MNQEFLNLNYYFQIVSDVDVKPIEGKFVIFDSESIVSLFLKFVYTF